MNLDDEIARKLTEAVAVGGVIHGNSTLVEEMKQVFIDNGWRDAGWWSDIYEYEKKNLEALGHVHIAQLDEEEYNQIVHKPGFSSNNYYPEVRMTGAEWYARYQTEKGFGSLDNLKDLPHTKDYSNGIDHAVMKCDEAARRASGIEEDK